jgi:LysR family carnitine catabolism transcriptional activator
MDPASLSIRHLRAFESVARLQSFTRAAAELHVSQPTLTVTVQQLESSVSTALFERTTRRISLTREGTAFLPIVERLLHDIDAAMSDIRTAGKERGGRLSISSVSAVTVRLLPTALQRFTQTFPSMSVHVHNGNSAEVHDRVKRGEADIGFASFTRDADLQFAPLFRDQLGLLARVDHPLLRVKRRLVWQDLEGHDFLGVSPGTATKPILEGLPDVPASVRAPRYALSSSEALEAMLLAGIGVAALPALHAARDTGLPLRFRMIGRPITWRTVYVIHRKGRRLPHSAPALIEAVRDCLRKICASTNLVELLTGDSGVARPKGEMRSSSGGQPSNCAIPG